QRTEQRQGLNLRYLRSRSRQEPWRRWLPDTRAASWRIGHNGIAPVIGPEHDDPGSRLPADRDAVSLGCVVCNRRQRRGVLRIKVGLLIWEKRDQHVVRGRSSGGLR